MLPSHSQLAAPSPGDTARWLSGSETCQLQVASGDSSECMVHTDTYFGARLCITNAFKGDKGIKLKLQDSFGLHIWGGMWSVSVITFSSSLPS